MTTAPAEAVPGFPGDVAVLRAQAAQVRIGPVLATCVLWPLAALFTAIGWLAGSAWYGIVLAALIVRYGFCKGARIQVVPGKPASPPAA